MNDAWTDPPCQPALVSQEVHIWLAKLTASEVELGNFLPLLSPEERARAEKFRSPERRAQWQMTRGLLRSLLARYTGLAAREIVITLGPHGKPALFAPANVALHFNLSHSGDYALFGFTRAGDMGVDLEKIRPDCQERDDIVRRYLAPGEQRAFFALEESWRTVAFTTLWTRKEAFVKARGDGLFSGLDQFEVALDSPRVLSVAGDASDWWMASIPSLPDYVGSVVVKARECSPRFWKWRV